MSESGNTPVAGGALAWRSDGTGPALVLVHAGVADLRMWEPLVPLLSAQRRVVRYDMRGFGQSRSTAGRFSPAADLLGLLDGLGLGAAAVLGASFGGLVALELAAIAPERVSALILLAPLHPGVEPSEELKAFDAAEERALEAGHLEEAVELNLATWVDRSSADPGIRTLVADMQRDAFVLQLETEIDLEEIDPPVVDRLGTIDVPAMIAVGDNDLPDFQLMAAQLAQELPNATLERIADAGHLLALERPRQVAELTLAAPS